jgi:hypothetical protein
MENDDPAMNMRQEMMRKASIARAQREDEAKLTVIKKGFHIIVTIAGQKCKIEGL